MVASWVNGHVLVDLKMETACNSGDGVALKSGW